MILSQQNFLCIKLLNLDKDTSNITKNTQIKDLYN